MKLFNRKLENISFSCPYCDFENLGQLHKNEIKIIECDCCKKLFVIKNNKWRITSYKIIKNNVIT